MTQLGREKSPSSLSSLWLCDSSLCPLEPTPSVTMKWHKLPRAVSVSHNELWGLFFSYCLHSSRTTKQKSQHGIRSWKIKENNQQRKIKAMKRGKGGSYSSYSVSKFVISKLNKISVQPWLSFPAWQRFKDFTSSHAVHVPQPCSNTDFHMIHILCWLSLLSHQWHTAEMQMDTYLLCIFLKLHLRNA